VPQEVRLAWSIYLNDDYEGGELEFLYFGKRTKLGAGDVVIFPAAFTHTHRGNMVTSGEKLLLTGWYELVPEETGA
jgi:predicted 2-oxoglutarate/Fe(II)-dependent dioxygenase YbiX